MKLNELINKIGMDKILHALVAAVIICFGGKFGDFALFISWVVVVALSVVKEFFFDKREAGNAPDLGDIWWALFGAFVETIYVLIATHV